MSINAIRTKLVTELGEITGVTKVYHDEPDVAPATPDLPCFILAFRDPCCLARSETNGSIEYTWQFSATFLYKDAGLGKTEENLSGLEDFIKLFVDKMGENISGAGTWRDWNKDTGTLEFTAGIIEKPNAPESTRYWGWTCTLDITESVATTFTS